MKYLLTLPTLIIVTICFVSCSSNKNQTKLLTPETLKEKQIQFLKTKNFLADNEDIIYFYSLSKLKDRGILLTNKKVLVYNNEMTDREVFSNIFDLATSHSLSEEVTSTITIYRRDDTEFKAEFLGGTDVDEIFFSTLREKWREALADK